MYFLCRGLASASGILPTVPWRHLPAHAFRSWGCVTT